MMKESRGLSPLLRIHGILKGLSAMDPSSARAAYPGFPNFAEHVSTLFSEDRLYDILPRLQLQIDIVRKCMPTVRPSMDPYVSTQIGVFSKNYTDWEIGRFLEYPDCCIRSFTEEIRYGLDERHSEELEGIKGVFVTTAGFVPCSVLCRDATARGLIAIVDRDEAERLALLEKEIFAELPHFHPEYREHYFEIRGR